MLNSEDYPSWLCSQCALATNGRLPTMACFHMDICGVCNEWKSVTEPRDYGYPKVKVYWNKKNILEELNKVKLLYEKEGNNFAANEVQERINRENKEKA